MLEIESTIENETKVLKVSGRLDAKSAKEATEAFGQAAVDAGDIVLDLEGLEYIASAGLRALRHLKKVVGSAGGEVTLRNVNDDIMEILEMTGFVAMFTFE